MYIICFLSIGAVSLDDSSMWCTATFFLVIAMNPHHSLYGNGTTMKLSQISPCHLRWQGTAEPRPATGSGLFRTRGIFQMPLIFVMQNATLEAWHCWWVGAEVSCFKLYSTPLVGWLVNCGPVCQIVVILVKTHTCSTAPFGWVFSAGLGL